MENTICNWPISANETLCFEIFPIGTSWNNIAGLYMFSFKHSTDRWRSLYIGQTNNLSNRLPNHERLPEAIQKGATHIHVLIEEAPTKRDHLEQKLIDYIKPVMNTQYK